MDLVKRGVPDEATTEAFAEMEDQLCVAVVTVLSFYFRWKVVGLKNTIEKDDTRGVSSTVLVALAEKRSTFVEAITSVVAERLPLDAVRVQALLATLDLYTLFATLKNMRPQKGELDEDLQVNLQGLTVKVDGELWKEAMNTLERMEKALARKTGRKIELSETKNGKKGRKGTVEREEETQEEIEKPPEDSDDDGEASEDGESSDDGDEAVEGGREAKKQAALMAEQALCEMGSKIVLATIAGVVPDKQAVKKRLQLNRGKLGKSYGQVIAYLDEKKERKKSKAKERMVTPQKKQKSKEVVPVELMEVEGDEIEDEEIEERNEDEIEDDDHEDEQDAGEEERGSGGVVEEPGHDDGIVGD